MAEMLAVPVLVEANVTEQLALIAVRVPRVHGLLVKDAPDVIPVWLNITVPMGLVAPAVAVSVTVAVHVDV